jgi:hypothetical protein
MEEGLSKGADTVGKMEGATENPQFTAKNARTDEPDGPAAKRIRLEESNGADTGTSRPNVDRRDGTAPIKAEYAMNRRAWLGGCDQCADYKS